jgi:hypothetical protein
MKKLLVGCVLLALTGVAQAVDRPGGLPGGSRTGGTPAARPGAGGLPGPRTATPAAQPAAAAAADPGAPAMGTWRPHKPAKMDSKGIDAAYAISDQLKSTGNIEAWTTLMHFPLAMVTDSSAGVPSMTVVDKAQFVEMMKPMLASMPKEAKVTSKHKLEFISESLALGIEDYTMMVGKNKYEWRSATLWVLDGGKWMPKGTIEGGWGDNMPAAP